jgi:hypothetical protein
MFSVVSVSAATSIDKISVTVDSPVAGNRMGYYGVIDSYSHCTFSTDENNYVQNGISWRDDTRNYDILVDDETETFIPGHDYLIEINLVVDYGYTVTPGTKYYINNQEATCFADGNEITLRTFFTVPLKKIKNIKITGVVAPVAGKKPSYTAKLSEGIELDPDSMAGQSGVVNGKRWWDANKLIALQSNETFRKNCNYNFNIWVKVKEGYLFDYEEDEDGDRYYKGTATINGKPAAVTISSFDTSMASLSIQFSTKPTVADSKVSGLEAKTYTGSKIYQSLTVKLDGKTLKKGTDYTLSYTNNINVGKAKVTIKGIGNYQGSRTLAFTIRPRATSITSLSGSSKAFTVKWSKKTTQTTGYQIRYSTSSTFSSYKTVTITSNQTTSKKITGLTAKKRYYVKVRTYKTVDGTKYYSLFSAKKSVTTK